MDLGRIDLAIEDGSFADEPALTDFIEALKTSGGTAHLLGVVSDGGVHGAYPARPRRGPGDRLGGRAGEVPRHHRRSRRGAEIRRPIHGGTGGGSARRAQEIATVVGRYFAMDRDRRWDRVEKAYRAIMCGEGDSAPSAADAVSSAWGNRPDRRISSPRPWSVASAGFAEGDGVFCLNFRADRAREILLAIGQPKFSEFDTGPRPKLAGPCSGWSITRTCTTRS